MKSNEKVLEGCTVPVHVEDANTHLHLGYGISGTATDKVLGEMEFIVSANGVLVVKFKREDLKGKCYHLSPQDFAQAVVDSIKKGK